MPALHVVGEILGASGLHAHEKTLALSHVVDLLSLDVRSRRSFFCRWRLVLNDESDDSDNNGKTSETSAWANTWEVMNGEQHGQTQVHSPSDSLSVPLTCDGSDNESELTSDVLLDVVWSHPIDLHVSTTVTFTAWPCLELEVWSLDSFHQSHLCGAARVCVPSVSREHVIDVPLARLIPSSWLDRVAESVAISAWGSSKDNSLKDVTSRLERWPDISEDERETCVESAGTVFLRVAVLQHGF